jgi:uncharacterized protein (TIRG00374 family)
LIDIDSLRGVLEHPGMLALALLLCVTTIPIASLRWHILLRSQGLNLHFFQTTRIVAMGTFFATFLPGSAGGDPVRGFYIFHASREQRTGALLSIFIDRLIGLSAFVLFGVAATLSRPWQNYGPFEYGILAFAGLLFGGMLILLKYGHRVAALISLLLIGRSRRLAAIIEDAGAALREYARQWRSVLFCLVTSLSSFSSSWAASLS